MDSCETVSGQSWKIVSYSGGKFTLTTLLREPWGECLEGNRFSTTSTLGGAAFMSNCHPPYSGQQFTAEKFELGCESI